MFEVFFGDYREDYDLNPELYFIYNTSLISFIEKSMSMLSNY